MSLGEMVGQGEVGWYTQRVKMAWPCLGLALKSLRGERCVFSGAGVFEVKVQDNSGKVA